MRKIFITLLIFNILCLDLQAQNRGIARCGNEFSDSVESGLQELFNNNRNNSSTGTVYKIPVVFHVLTDQPTDVSNISDCIIQNQVAILNNCFRRKAGTPNTTPAGADAEIEFYLARKNPSGGPTNGINRVTTANCNYTNLTSTSNTQTNAIRTAAKWPINKYLNIWVLKTMPNNNGVRGQAWTGGADMGIFIHYSFVGSKNASCPNLSYIDVTGFSAYDLGMTLVHEVGHYLSLFHTFAPSSQNCTTTLYTDGCDDTPKVVGLPTGGVCGEVNNTKGVCVSGQTRLWQNYMDNTDDVCMDRFTTCQVGKMRTYLTSTTNYSNLITNSNFIATGGDIATSVNDLTQNNSLSVYPNPASHSIWVERKLQAGPNEFAILNMEGKIISQGRLTGFRQEINLRHLQPGFYVFKLNGESKKFVVQ